MGKKWDDARPAEKIVSLYSLLLFSGRKWSLKELSEKLNSSKTSVLRLIDQLEGARYGKIIKSKEGRESFYEIDRPSGLPRISLDNEGLQQLALCRDFIWHLLPQSIRKSLSATLALASAFRAGAVGGADDLEPLAFAGAQAKGHIDYTPFEDMYHDVLRAIRRKKNLRRYLSVHSGRPGPEFQLCAQAAQCLSRNHSSQRLDSGRKRPGPL